MTTITGTLENTSGSPLHVRVTFKSRSTPIVTGGTIFGATTTSLKTSPTDGTFSVQLAAGKYDVTYFTTPDQTKFEITVPDSNDTVTIGSITSSPLAFVFTPPNTVWNGVRQGHITFDPIADPAGGFSLATQAYTGGHIVAGDTYVYRSSYVTADGETLLSSVPVSYTPPSVSPGNTALRVNFGGPALSRVLARRIWRTKVSPSDGVFYLLAQLAPNATFYDDWESHADFATRAAHPPNVPTFNTTAGVIYPSIGGSPILYFSTSGLRCLSDATFDGNVTFSSAGANILSDGSINWGNTAGELTPTGGAAFGDNVQLQGGAIVDGDPGSADVKFIATGGGPVIKAPNGSFWRIKVSNAGVLSTESA